AAFGVESINRKGAVFDEQKLEWLNSQYINDLPVARLADLVEPDLARAGLLAPDLKAGGARRDSFLPLLETLQPPSKRPPDFARRARPFLSDDFEYAPDAVAKPLAGGGKAGGPPDIATRMRTLGEVLAGVTPFDEAATEAALRSLADRRGETAALFIHPL